MNPALPYLAHVLREEVDAEHTGNGACYADSPCQAVDHQSPQILETRVPDAFMVHLRQQLLEREEDRERDDVTEKGRRDMWREEGGTKTEKNALGHRIPANYATGENKERSVCVCVCLHVP